MPDMHLDLNLDEALPRPAARPAATPPPLDLVAQRLAFAAWPQARVHASWLEALAQASGVPVANAGHGAAARAVAHALWTEAGVPAIPPAAPVPVDRLPAWALQAVDDLHRQLATAGALNLLPELRAAVRGDAIRHWDAVLGPGLRRNTLRWCRQNLAVDVPPHARPLRSQAQAAARSPEAWQAFCQAMALAELAELGTGVQARMRLAWPHALRHVPPLALDPAAARWLHTCLKVAGVMLADLARPDGTEALAGSAGPAFAATRPLATAGWQP